MLAEVRAQTNDPNAAVKRLAEEAYGDVYEHMTRFSDAVLLTIISNLGAQVNMVEISSEVDMRDRRPILFVDEPVMSELVQMARDNAESSDGE